MEIKINDIVNVEMKVVGILSTESGVNYRVTPQSNKYEWVSVRESDIVNNICCKEC